MSTMNHFLGDIRFLEPTLLNPIPHCFLQENFVESRSGLRVENCNGLVFDAFIFSFGYRDLNALKIQVY